MSSEFSAFEEDRELSTDDFTPDAEPQPTWCPGCGDFSVAKSLKKALMETGHNPDETLLVTGIGCSGKLSSYVDTYGFHTIHGRTLPLARGAKLANPDLEVIAAGGDGDGYGIGGNHFVHTARENPDLTYIVFNNEIFGLTKGQTSPTSPKGHKSKTQPHGSAKDPIRPLSLSLTSGSTYVARTAATNPRQAATILAEAIEHDGFAHVDFLTQCPTWNKDAQSYVPFIDIDQSDEYEFDETDRSEAMEMMQKAESALYEGEILTGRFYVDETRPTLSEEKMATGEMPESPLAKRYYHDDPDFERSYQLLDRHT
ncbi:2-ketoglutarate ferredoxin oxidoreductase subunit beta [Salinarchaeum sp. IM2453]|uniref:thiamine pyrophosphate-dependent enzyme n=1 Tax=Salinarchaeum sp. IM2453 TaxID=2862870 RepID=UPI001C83ED5D|nr:thiamine pyrophosphate-dependent enzyme [Salinarchaeum sp. IM2453]QZA87954.1 2-ketoglutarate ferredoxin oxidoreductase subunit beta [Salinarchaeum sp. IM2453]